jgi:tRNA (cmo5U34)-methyltransferase
MRGETLLELSERECTTMPSDNEAIGGFFCPNKILLQDLKGKKPGKASGRKKAPEPGGGVFDWLAPHYDSLGPVLDPSVFAVHSIILEVLNALEPSPVRILDLGCGTGLLAQQILEMLPDSHVFALDNSLAMLQVARGNLEDFMDRATLLKADFRDPWEDVLEGPVDAVVHYSALHHLPHPALREVLSRTAGILRPGGWFINADSINLTLPDPVRAVGNSIRTSRDEASRLDSGEMTGLLEEFGAIRAGSDCSDSDRIEEFPATSEQLVAWMIEAGFECSSRIYQDWNISVFLSRKPE